ncbi:MAG: multicopper oxidase domain-containing protein [Burkholderiales bacterium]
MTKSSGGMGQTCYVYPGHPATPGLVTADVVYNRGIYMNGSITMDDGTVVTIWGYTDTSGGGMGGNQFPSPAMRVTEGQIVHTALSVGDMWAHTVHHHGIEPSWQNDGVGHISWDVEGGTYTYQWRPAHAGTYFYHCHVNTVLHAEMGMYGALIVDPVPDPNDPPGTKRAFAGGPTYDVEAIWACDEIDPAWHTLPWNAGTCGGDVGLNDLNPKYFIITGVDGATSALTAPGIAVNMTLGQTLLVRYICAGYFPQRITFGGLTATVVASDGRPLPTPIYPTSIEACWAESYDCILKPTATGTYTVTVEFMHWITGAVVGTARTRINVA